MVFKYIVPKHEREKYNKKKVLYCKVLDRVLLVGTKNEYICRVQILNNRRFGHYKVTVLYNKELQELNMIDKIKVFFMKER